MSEKNMYGRLLRFSMIIACCAFVSVCCEKVEAQTAGRGGGDFSNDTQPITKVPEGVILVKGAWASASDAVTPLPEGGNVTNDVFTDPYFGISYALPSGWTQKFDGPPPSDSGRYVLAQLRPGEGYKGTTRG